VFLRKQESSATSELCDPEFLLAQEHGTGCGVPPFRIVRAPADDNCGAISHDLVPRPGDLARVDVLTGDDVAAKPAAHDNATDLAEQVPTASPGTFSVMMTSIGTPPSNAREYIRLVA
jgi:hypothetical protein